MNNLKIINSFVNDQLEDFFNDFADSKKNIKLFSVFSKISATYEKSDIKISSPKKSFKSKIKVTNKKSNKNIF